MPWIIIILLFPIVGSLLYLIIGRNLKLSKILKRITENEKNITMYLKQDKKVYKEIKNNTKLRYISDFAGFPISTNNDVDYYPLGELAFEEMIKELRKAKKFIFFEYFIVAHGKMWDSILEILKEKGIYLL